MASLRYDFPFRYGFFLANRNVYAPGIVVYTTFFQNFCCTIRFRPVYTFSRPITSKSTHDDGMDVKDHVHAEYRLSTADDTTVSYAGLEHCVPLQYLAKSQGHLNNEHINRKIEISKQIAVDLQLARKRCNTMIKPVRQNDPIGLTESRFKIQSRNSKTPFLVFLLYSLAARG